MSSPVRTPSRRVGSSGCLGGVPWSYRKPDKASGLVNQGHKLGGKPASTAADSLSISRLLRRAAAFFAPAPCWWTLANVPSTITALRSSSSSITSKIRWNTPDCAQRRKRRCTVFQFPNSLGRSRQGAPVRVIQIIPSSDIRLLLPLRPGVPGLPGKAGSISRHCLSVRVSLASNPVPPHNTSLRYCKLYSVNCTQRFGLCQLNPNHCWRPCSPLRVRQRWRERPRRFLAGIDVGWLATCRPPDTPTDEIPDPKEHQNGVAASILGSGDRCSQPIKCPQALVLQPQMLGLSFGLVMAKRKSCICKLQFPRPSDSSRCHLRL